MALAFEMNANVLHVTETIHGWHRTRISHWYYDLAVWRVSSHGRLGDVPDRAMPPAAIDWVKRHYLPKLQSKGESAHGSDNKGNPDA